MSLEAEHTSNRKPISIPDPQITMGNFAHLVGSLSAENGPTQDRQSAKLVAGSRRDQITMPCSTKKIGRQVGLKEAGLFSEWLTNRFFSDATHIVL